MHFLHRLGLFSGSHAHAQSSVLDALSSHGVLSLTGTNIQVASRQGCTLGLAGTEPSGIFIHPGQHLHGSSGYLNFVLAGLTPFTGPQGT